jgi:acetyl esterase/lipase
LLARHRGMLGPRPVTKPRAKTPGQRMSQLLRLLAGLGLSALSLLTVVQPPGRLVLPASVFATEFGYALALVAAMILLPGWRRSRIGRIGALLGVVGVLPMFIPVVGAMEAGRELPEQFVSRFGEKQRTPAAFSQGPRPFPFQLVELVRPTQSRPVRYQRIVITNGGHECGLDIFHPSYLHARIPAVVVIHGESWQPGGDEFLALDGYLAARDYVVAALVPATPGSQLGAGCDVISTIQYLKANYETLGLDPGRLAVVGRSIAGHLALLAAYTAHDPAIRGAVSLYAPTDLRALYASASQPQALDTRALLRQYLGGDIQSAGAAYDAASPINFVGPTSPATLLVHGMQDRVVPPDQSERLAMRLSEQRVRNLFIRLPWAMHGCDKSFAGPCGQITTYAVERFLNGVMVETVPPPEPAKSRRRERAAHPLKLVDGLSALPADPL